MSLWRVIAQALPVFDIKFAFTFFLTLRVTEFMYIEKVSHLQIFTH